MQSTRTTDEREPRLVCARCRRPASVCYCSSLPSIPTETRVVLLQHRRERDVPIGTAHMASLCLPNSELLVGVDWTGNRALDRLLSDPTRPPILLYPGPGARDVVIDPPPGPVTLVVVDGTWWQAKKVIKINPRLAELPRYAFTPPAPSEYRIRREPHLDYVSTIEALMHVLGALERDPHRFKAMLDPFRAMIDAQIRHVEGTRNARVRNPRPPRPPRVRVPSIFAERANDLVCVYGEANAFPYGTPEREAHPQALVHWVAVRLGKGETFERVIAPVGGLAPNTTRWIGLDEETLSHGATMAETTSAWRDFVKETDVVCSWGTYATKLFIGANGVLPTSHIDVREAARQWANGKVGSPGEVLLKLEMAVPKPMLRGRAGARLSELAAITKRFAEPER